jgi:hypothetical protein
MASVDAASASTPRSQQPQQHTRSLQHTSVIENPVKKDSRDRKIELEADLDDDLDPAAFLKSVRELSEKREREDNERFRKLEEEIAVGRQERLARRQGVLCGYFDGLDVDGKLMREDRTREVDIARETSTISTATEDSRFEFET